MSAAGLPSGDADEAAWVDRARRVLQAGEPSDVDRLLEGHPPAVAQEVTALAIAPLLAAIAWAGAVLREVMIGSPVDPIAVVLRVVALGFTVRTVVLVARFLPRLAVLLWSGRYRLVLTPEGLLLSTPRGERAVPKGTVVGVAEGGDPRASWRPVHVVLSGPGTHLTLPPVFDDSPGLLAERLQRWLGAPPEVDDGPWPTPYDRPIEVYDEAVRGRPPPGSRLIRHGRGWMRTGPVFPLLVAAVVVESLVRLGPEGWSVIDPRIFGSLALVMIAIPAVWYGRERRDVAHQGGASMLLTPAEVLIRTPKGVIRSRWADLARVSIDQRRRWSVLEGPHTARTLVLARGGAPTIRYQESYLGVPAEVAMILLQAYQRRRLPEGPTVGVDGPRPS
ncbi:MAG: hypothetical protein ACFCGT_22080 [Sandaracinaceae bacterium]